MRRICLILSLFFHVLSADELPFKSYLIEGGVAVEYKSENDWFLFDETEGIAYLNLDNQTVASYDAVVDDPFLVIRTKVGGKSARYTLAASWYHYSRFSPFQMVVEDNGKRETSPLSLQRRVNDTPALIFDKSPSFSVAKEPQIWWQIALDPEFKQLIPNCDQLEEEIDEITIDPIAETFFSPNTPYYFRYKPVDGEWSEPLSFRVAKPNAPKEIVLEKTLDERLEIRWQESDDPDVTFWIFASNALDFVPSLYTDRQINAICPAGILAEEANDNLLLKTKEPVIEVDGSFAYLRILAEKDGIFSVPSPIVHVYDYGMHHKRTVLQRASGPVMGLAKRVLFPLDNETSQTKEIELVARVKPPAVAEPVWQAVFPYLMPDNHPIRAQLDRLFSASRVLLNSSSLRAAGFENTVPGMFSKAIISENSRIKGYFFKMFSDSQPNIIDWEQWVRRAYGSISLKNAVLQRGLTKEFVVPKKWIYPLPATPVPPPNYTQKYFILVAEKIKIEAKSKNYSLWKKKMTRERLKNLVILMQAEGLIDCNRAFNVPFAKDGRNAFIDLEHNHFWPVHFDPLKRWLSSHNQIYLDELKAAYGH